MDTAEVFRLANAAAPELMERTAATLSQLEQEDPEMAKVVKDDFRTIVSRTSEGVEKTAGLFGSSSRLNPKTVNAAKEVGKKFLFAGGTALGVAVATDLWEAARRGLTEGRNFRRMMDSMPEEVRHELKSKDMKDVRDAFNSLHRFAPDMAADPMFAASMVHSLIGMPQTASQRIIEAINARKAVSDVKRNQIGLSAKDLLQFYPEKEDRKDVKDRLDVMANLFGSATSLAGSIISANAKKGRRGP